MITTFFGWFSVRTYQQTSSTVSTELRERSEENLNQKEMEREKALAEQAENEKVTEDGVGEDSSSSTPFCTDDEDEGEDEGEA